MGDVILNLNEGFTKHGLLREDQNSVQQTTECMQKRKNMVTYRKNRSFKR